MKTIGNHRTSTKTNDNERRLNQQTSAKINETQRKSMKKSLKINEIHWKSLKINRQAWLGNTPPLIWPKKPIFSYRLYWWTMMCPSPWNFPIFQWILQTMWKSMKIYRKSMKINRKSLKIIGLLMKSNENHWNINENQ